MTLYEFKDLEDYKQLEAMWLHGIRLAYRKEGEVEFTLYQIDGFYIEDKFDIPNDIRYIKSFISTEPLEAYLSQIDISQLRL